MHVFIFPVSVTHFWILSHSPKYYTRILFTIYSVMENTILSWNNIFARGMTKYLEKNNTWYQNFRFLGVNVQKMNKNTLVGRGEWYNLSPMNTENFKLLNFCRKSHIMDIIVDAISLLELYGSRSNESLQQNSILFVTPSGYIFIRQKFREF